MSNLFVVNVDELNQDRGQELSKLLNAAGLEYEAVSSGTTRLFNGTITVWFRPDKRTRYDQEWLGIKEIVLHFLDPSDRYKKVHRRIKPKDSKAIDLDALKAKAEELFALYQKAQERYVAQEDKLRQKLRLEKDLRQSLSNLDVDLSYFVNGKIKFNPRVQHGVVSVVIDGLSPQQAQKLMLVLKEVENDPS